MARALAASTLLIALAGTPVGRADVPVEPLGVVETVSEPFLPHRVWVADPLLGRSALVDLDDGRFLGMIDGGYGMVAPLFSLRRSEIYVPSTYYSRRTHGDRTDAVAIWDARTLSHLGEVVVPPKRAIDAVSLAHSALSDDERFIALYNYTPAQSLSIVDAERRAFTGEVPIPGCGLVYAAGDRRFLALCGDGAAFTVTLDDDGRVVDRKRSARFFDPNGDPVTEKAVRWRDVWVFVSFAGMVHTIDVSGPDVIPGEAWSLLDEDDRADEWRPGGLQHLAVHEASGRLFSLMHRGGPDTHKEPGDEVWVYDLEKRERVQRIELVSPGVTVMGFPIELDGGWLWLSDWLTDALVPPLVGQIQVTQGDEPVLFTASQYFGSIGLYDARDGEFLGRVKGIGMTTDVLQAPGRARRPR